MCIAIWIDPKKLSKETLVEIVRNLDVARPEVWEELANSPYEEVRIAVASNPKTLAYVLKVMRGNDTCAEVRNEASMNIRARIDALK